MLFENPHSPHPIPRQVPVSVPKYGNSSCSQHSIFSYFFPSLIASSRRSVSWGEERKTALKTQKKKGLEEAKKTHGQTLQTGDRDHNMTAGF